MKNIKDKLIIFDLGNVIIDIDMSRTIAAMETLGVKNITTYVTQSHSVGGFFTDLERGLISDIDFYNNIRSMAHISASDKAIRDAWNAMIDIIPEEKIKLIENLKLNNTVVLLSNTNKIHWDYFDRLAFDYGYCSLSDLFHKTWYSHEMHLSKPDKNIYQQVLSYHNQKPENTLFFDDSTVNLDSAKELGINTFLVNPHNKGLWQYFEKIDF